MPGIMDPGIPHPGMPEDRLPGPPVLGTGRSLVAV